MWQRKALDHSVINLPHECPFYIIQSLLDHINIFIGLSFGRMESPTKKFINLPKDAVRDCLQGVVKLNPQLGILQNTQVVALKNLKNKVHLIGGGVSGHEPADAGYLYDNGLSAAVCGGPFASPSSEEVLSAI